MKYTQIIFDIASANGYSVDAVRDIAKTITSRIADGIESGERIEIPGFGMFYAKRRAPRIGRDMNRGASPVMIPERHVPVFEPSREFKDRIEKAFRGGGGK